MTPYKAPYIDGVLSPRSGVANSTKGWEIGYSSGHHVEFLMPLKSLIRPEDYPENSSEPDVIEIGRSSMANRTTSPEVPRQHPQAPHAVTAFPSQFSGPRDTTVPMQSPDTILDGEMKGQPNRRDDVT